MAPAAAAAAKLAPKPPGRAGNFGPAAETAGGGGLTGGGGQPPARRLPRNWGPWCDLPSCGDIFLLRWGVCNLGLGLALCLLRDLLEENIMLQPTHETLWFKKCVPI